MIDDEAMDDGQAVKTHDDAEYSQGSSKVLISGKSVPHMDNHHH